MANPFLKKRFERFRQLLTDNRMDGALITGKVNFQYLLGFKTEADCRLFVPAANSDCSPMIFTSQLEEEIVRARNPFPEIDLFIRTKSLGSDVLGTLKVKKARSIIYNGKEYLTTVPTLKGLLKSEFNSFLDDYLVPSSDAFDFPGAKLDTAIANGLRTNKVFTTTWEKQAILSPSLTELGAIAELIGDYNMSIIGFEHEFVTYQEYLLILQKLKKATVPMPKLVNVASILQIMRIHKDPDEIEKLRAAAAIGDIGFAAGENFIHEGATENEVQAEIEYAMKKAGAEKPSFETIVVSGYKSAFPHGHAGQKKIEMGNLVTVDLGAIYQGYCSDMTRTVIAGHDASTSPKSADVLSIHRTVNRAYEIGFEAAKIGASWSAPDIAVRSFFEKEGVLKYYVHGLGHGVGVQVHESPRIVYSQIEPEKIIEVGMVFTVEPGVYKPGIGGARTENTVVVTEKGVEVLNKTPITSY